MSIRTCSSQVAALEDEVEKLRAEREAEIATARRTADYWKAEHLAGNAVIAAQRKVLEQALEALQWEHGGEPLPTLTTAAITAIQGILK